MTSALAMIERCARGQNGCTDKLSPAGAQYRCAEILVRMYRYRTDMKAARERLQDLGRLAFGAGVSTVVYTGASAVPPLGGVLRSPWRRWWR